MAVEQKYDRPKAMAEEEPNQNVPDNGGAETKPLWGPQHAGAKELASQYTFGNQLRCFKFYFDTFVDFCLTACMRFKVSVNAVFLP